MQSGSSVRLHRRKRFLDGAPWSVLSPRPSDLSRYATVRVDGRWQLDCDLASLDDLAHMVWATAFQNQTRTMILFDRPSLLPPVADEPESIPFVLVPAELDEPTAAVLEALRSELPQTRPSEGTVRLRTAGLDRALTAPGAFVAKEAATEDAKAWDANEWNEWVGEVSGVLRIMAPAPVLRAYALAAAEIGSLAWGSADGEEPSTLAHEFVCFDRSIVRRSEALRAYRESEFPGRTHADLSAADRQQLWDFTQR